MDGKGYGIALPKRHDFSTALHARPLLGAHELAASEILARLREEDRNLDWECEIAVEVLVQAIEVTRNILQQQRRWAPLARVDIACEAWVAR